MKKKNHTANALKTLKTQVNALKMRANVETHSERRECASIAEN